MSSYGSLLDSLRGVHWPARRPMRAALPGAHASRARGNAPELAERRLYRQGDDPRRLDWRLLARTDRPYVKLANDRAVLALTLVLDRSASMAFPAGDGSKWAYGRLLAVGLAAVARADGDPVGLAVPGSAAALAARSRRDVVPEIARILADVPASGRAPLLPALESARPGGRIVVLSDFLGDDAPLLTRAAARHRAAGSEVHAVHVLARDELDPPARVVLAADPEHDDVRRPLSPENRGAYLAALAAWCDETARAWRESGATYTRVTTDEPPARAVRRVVAGGGEPAPDAA